MKIAAYGCGQNYTSARFRVRQFIGDLATYDIHVHEYIAPIYKHLEPKSHNPVWLAAIKVARPIALMPSVIASHRYDASWIQKEMMLRTSSAASSGTYQRTRMSRRCVPARAIA